MGYAVFVRGSVHAALIFEEKGTYTQTLREYGGENQLLHSMGLIKIRI